jgi:hypothetical protein
VAPREPTHERNPMIIDVSFKLKISYRQFRELALLLMLMIQ